jgi:hypothetical protein
MPTWSTITFRVEWQAYPWLLTQVIDRCIRHPLLVSLHDRWIWRSWVLDPYGIPLGLSAVPGYLWWCTVKLFKGLQSTWLGCSWSSAIPYRQRRYGCIKSNWTLCMYRIISPVPKSGGRTNYDAPCQYLFNPGFRWLTFQSPVVNSPPGFKSYHNPMC